MDYFNEDERQFQRRFSAFRDRISAPIVTFLLARGVSPNQATVLGVLFLLLSSLFGSQYFWLVAIFLLLYCLMDALDGSLARASGKASEAGALLDIIADQLGVVIVPAAAVYHLASNGSVAVLFSSLYVSFVALIVFSNQKGIAVPKFIRTKYILYAVYVAALFFAFDIVTFFMAAFVPYYAVMFIVVVRRAYTGMIGPENT